MLWAIVALFLSNCSTQKNKFLNKAYHNVTTRYNIYFNARESFKEGKTKIETGYKENYSQILPVFIYPDNNSSKSIYPEMDRTIEKCSKGVQKHSMYIKKTEYNKWIDDSYLLMAKAHFYKRDFFPAIETFEYIAKAYKKEEMSHYAKLWLVRCYIEMENFDKANRMLDLITNDKDFPEKLKDEYGAIYADFYIRQKNYNLAVSELKTAIAHTKRRKPRVRYVYILAQLYHELENYVAASQFYAQVIKMAPNYEMEFYAKINRAMAYDVGTGSSAEIRKELNKMLKDDKKNKEFFDQIYYALGELELKEGHRDRAIELFKKSAASSVSNNNQKGKAFLKLAELYFEEPEYKLAQVYYDSATMNLNREHPRFEKILNIRNSLTRLVRDILIVEREDSLQQLAAVSEKERMKTINRIIQKIVEEEEQKRLEEQQNNLLPINKQYNSTTSQGKQQGGWYFYNPNTLSFGYSEFKKIWGDRQPEDNWRRKSKSVSSFSNAFDDDFAFETLEDEDTTAGANDLKNPNYYLKNVPTNEEKLNRSHNRIIEAYYDLALVYKERLEDNEKAIETFEELIRRYDTCRYVVNSYYQLYRLYQAEGLHAKSDKYKAKILKEFPDSEYAQILTDPNYFKKKQKEQKAATRFYEQTYQLYSDELYAMTVQQCEKSDSLYPGNPLSPKFRYLRALAIGKSRGKEELISALHEVIDKHPNDEEALHAKKILDLLGQPTNGKHEPEPEQEIYNFSFEGDHSCALIVPAKGAKINELKIAVSDFNNKYFKLANLKVSSVLLGKDHHMISVKKFKNKDKAMDYHMAFTQNTDMLKDINSKGFDFFAISYENYPVFYSDKSVDKYLLFFNKKYRSE